MLMYFRWNADRMWDARKTESINWGCRSNWGYKTMNWMSRSDELLYHVYIETYNKAIATAVKAT